MPAHHTVERPSWPGLSLSGIALALLFVVAPAQAQTDYYNTDAGRPVRIEDAYAIERRGFELQAAPLRLERGRNGQYRWGIEPELAYGMLPRTQLEVGLPFAFVDGSAAQRTAGLAGIDVSVLHNLNAETRIPALAIVASALLPAGNLAPDATHASLKGILTKTLPGVRLHLNAQYTFAETVKHDANGVGSSASSVDVGAGVTELSRWFGGIAVDHTFPLRSLLLTGEVYAQQPLDDAADAEWNATVGTRYQLSPRWAIDAGIGRRLSGDDRTWSFTMGGAVAFGLPWSR